MVVRITTCKVLVSALLAHFWCLTGKFSRMERAVADGPLIADGGEWAGVRSLAGLLRGLR